MSRAHVSEGSNDSYSAFMKRLETAIFTLREKRALIDLTKPLVAALHGDNQVGYEGWVNRRRLIEDAIDQYQGSPKGYETLAALLRDAKTLERTFEERANRVQKKLRLIEEQQNQIDASIMDLEQSQAKLELSRMLTQERNALNKTIATLDGGATRTAATVGGAALGAEIRSAREAVFLAEALLEIKGH